MRRKINYSNAPRAYAGVVTETNIVPDFLPPPEQLLKKKPKTKITITLNSNSINFFKKFAEKNNVKYQTMINEVLDLYVQKFSDRVDT